MISDIQDILAVVRRLDAKRNDPPQPLSRQRDRDRDGPTKDHGHMPVLDRDHKHHSQPQLPNVWNWRSKQM